MLECGRAGHIPPHDADLLRERHARQPPFYPIAPVGASRGNPYPLHLGHAHTMILADAMPRYRRLAADDASFLTGAHTPYHITRYVGS
jgi:hypothetical protein